MQPTRIAELLKPYLGPPEARSLKPEAYERISTYIDLLQRWNARINLTAIRDEQEIVTRHFGESLFAASYLFPDGTEAQAPVDAASTETIAAKRRQSAAHGASRGRALLEEQAPQGRKKMHPTVADVGSGAGFPGIPIKLWAPEISLTLIESNHKKATFLKEVTRALTLTNINIQTTRAESLAASSFDLVTLRAVERFETILPTVASLVNPKGRLALLIGSAQLAQAKSILTAWNWHPQIQIPGSQSRILAIATIREPT